MSFGNLLAAGKSFISGRRGAAYREDRRVYVPKFESAKNPFAKTTPAPSGQAPVASIVPVQSAVAPKAVAKTNAVSVFAPAKISSVPASQPPPANWAAKLNPMAMFRGTSAPTARPVVAVQTELSLDSVKVVQNDLSDAEVEVVPIKSRPARPAGSGEAAESWDDLGAKIFGANAV